MHLRFRILTVCLTIVVSLSFELSQVFGQSGDAGDAGAFLKFGFGVRGAAFGESFAAIASDPSAVYYNPAGVGFAKKVQAEVSLNRPYTNLNAISYYSFAALLPFPGFKLGLGAAMLSVGDIEEAFDRTGPTGATFEDTELAFFFSYGIAFSDRLAFGANFKIISQEIHSYSAAGYGFDLSILYKGSKFSYGFIIRDLVGAKLQLNQRSDQMPLKLTFALGYRPFKRFTTALGIQGAGDRAATLQPAIDFELVPDILSLRESYSTKSKAFKLGFSLRITTFNIDYFYSLNNELGDSNAIGLRWTMK